MEEMSILLFFSQRSGDEMCKSASLIFNLQTYIYLCMSIFKTFLNLNRNYKQNLEWIKHIREPTSLIFYYLQQEFVKQRMNKNLT